MEPEPFPVAEWQAAMREAYGGLDDSEVARLTRMSQPWINQIRNGRVPSRETLIRIVERLGVDGDLRRRLFRLAGYADPGEWDPDAAFMTGLRALMEEMHADFTISADDLALARESAEGVEAALAAVRKRLEEKRAGQR